jgi:hypothetical protein
MMWPGSIREINNLPEVEKRAIYTTLIPDWVYTNYGLNKEKLAAEGHEAVQIRCPKGSRALEISVKRKAIECDPVLYLNMADTFNNQLIVLLVVVNDPDSERFNIDVDEYGNKTHLGTTGRNASAEKAAMKAGLAPGQIRRGLRSFKTAVPLFEEFVKKMGHDMFLIEPLAYHNAIIFERYGFNYLRGYKDMMQIDKDFRPGGEVFLRLSADNPFRHPDYWNKVRGRSWAVHDGILGHPFTGFQMYKRIGLHAGVNTFPDGQW